MQESHIFAGARENTFEENYGVKVPLPMPESEFLATLRRLKLTYELRAKRPGIILAANRCRDLDPPTIQKAYQIWGNLNETALRHPGGPEYFSGVRDVYDAFVDSDGNVVCIENGFMYEGP